MELDETGGGRPAFSAATCNVPVPAPTAEPAASPQPDADVSRRSDSDEKQDAESPATAGGSSAQPIQEGSPVAEADKVHRRLEPGDSPIRRRVRGAVRPERSLTSKHLLKSHGIGVHWDVIRKRNPHRPGGRFRGQPERSLQPRRTEQVS